MLFFPCFLQRASYAVLSVKCCFIRAFFAARLLLWAFFHSCCWLGGAKVETGKATSPPIITLVTYRWAWPGGNYIVDVGSAELIRPTWVSRDQILSGKLLREKQDRIANLGTM